MISQIEKELFAIRNLDDLLRKYKKVYKEMLLMYKEDKEFYQNTYTNSKYTDIDLEYAIKLCNLYLSKFRKKRKRCYKWKIVFLKLIRK